MQSIRPQHYKVGETFEAINVIEAWDLDFCLGNVVKYIARHGKKGSAIEDLRKAEWYLRRKIQQLENDAKGTNQVENGTYSCQAPELPAKRLSDDEALQSLNC